MKGITLRRRHEDEVPGEDDLTAGDPDVDALKSALVGEEAPGGSVATPDQDRVDDIGRALGVEEVDSGALRTTTELMERRDRRRAQADEPESSE
jgi:hypothetical protein